MPPSIHRDVARIHVVGVVEAAGSGTLSAEELGLRAVTVLDALMPGGPKAVAVTLNDERLLDRQSLVVVLHGVAGLAGLPPDVMVVAVTVRRPGRPVDDHPLLGNPPIVLRFDGRGSVDAELKALLQAAVVEPLVGRVTGVGRG